VVEQGKLLTLTTEEAVRLGYAQEVADLNALLAAIGAPALAVHTTEVNWAENVVRFLTHPAVAPLLLTLGFLGILFELKTPAFGLAGTVGVASLAAFFGSRYLVGLAGMEELLLIGAGTALIAVEIFVIPGFGVAGIAGALAVGAGIMLSLVGIAATPAEWSQAAGILSLSLLVGIVIAWALLRKLPKTGRFTRTGIMHGASTSREGGYLSQPARADLIGSVGVALTDLRPSGAARFGEERVDVVSDSSWINAGTPIRVVRAEGYRHVVEPVPAITDEPK
ncbi:MAG: NfeD family protein, partial [Longimicrobiales bacterium]